MIPTLPERRISDGFACGAGETRPVGSAPPRRSSRLLPWPPIGLLALLSILVGCNGAGQEQESLRSAAAEYAASVRSARTAKDRALSGEGSPIPAAERASFAGLRYYPPDTAWRLTVRFHPAAEPIRLELGTSTGEERRMDLIGTLRFLPPGLGDDSLDLSVYRPVDTPDGDWFVPFADRTNGETTYGAGRYLEVDDRELAAAGGETTLTLDFNYAYNPYCAYDPSYSCPLVPPANALPIRVEAGERIGRSAY